MYFGQNSVPITTLGGGSIVIHYAKTKTRVMNTGSNIDVVNGNSTELTRTGKLTVKVMPNLALTILHYY